MSDIVISVAVGRAESSTLNPSVLAFNNLYCSLGDLKNELRNFSQLVPSNTTETSWANHMIKRADSYINMRLNRRYGAHIPFNPVPDAIWSISIQLTSFYCLMSNYAGQAVEKLEAVYAAYGKPAIEALNWLSKGNLELPEIDGTSSDFLGIDSTTDDYRKEFRITREDVDGNTVVDGNMDSTEW